MLTIMYNNVFDGITLLKNYISKMFMLQLTFECIKRGYDGPMSCSIINTIIEKKKLEHCKVTLTLYDWYKRQLFKEIPELRQIDNTIFESKFAKLALYRTFAVKYDLHNTELDIKHKLFTYNFDAPRLVMNALKSVRKEIIV